MVVPIDLAQERAWKKAFEVGEQNDVVLPMEVYPTGVTIGTIVSLSATGLLRVEYLIQGLLLDIADSNVKILAQRYVTVAVYHQLAADAQTRQAQMASAP